MLALSIKLVVFSTFQNVDRLTGVITLEHPSLVNFARSRT